MSNNDLKISIVEDSYNDLVNAYHKLEKIDLKTYDKVKEELLKVIRVLYIMKG